MKYFLLILLYMEYILPYHVNRKPSLKALASWGLEIQTYL